jgi:hypothetical protein
MELDREALRIAKLLLSEDSSERSAEILLSCVESVSRPESFGTQAPSSQPASEAAGRAPRPRVPVAEAEPYSD